MEEDISKYDEKCVIQNVISEEDVDNWTFVHNEDVLGTNKSHSTNQQEDSSDNYSEQGSDSGSSIVVIDSPILPSCDSHHVLGQLTQQELLKNDERQVEGIDGSDNVSCFSHQSNNEFLKECSPYEDIEQPDSWDCDHEADVSQTDSKEVENNEEEDKEETKENQCYNQQESGIEDDEAKLDEQSLTATDEAEVNLVLIESVHENVSSQIEFIKEMDKEIEIVLKSPDFHNQEVTGDDVIGPENKQLGDLVIETSFHESQANSQNGQGSNEENDDEIIPSLVDMIECLIERQPDPDDDPENLESEDENDSSGSVDNDSEEETWDLSLGALANNNSLASSLSSLVQQPSSPSPAAEVPPRNFVISKPDLLEEANRIEELDLMDYSAVTNPDLPAELVVANIVPDRHYVHHPNQRLNLQLTFIVAFALAAVFGFALGHIVGLSDNFPSRCQSADNKRGNPHHYEGWTDEDWLSEVNRLTTYNEELSRTLKELTGQESTNCRFDFQVNELVTENWDLKQSIGRIRYGKPTRSVEDRDTINRLTTENQDLRATVGKLRYRCGQPLPNPQNQIVQDSTPVNSFVPVYPSAEPLWKLLGDMNLTSSWNHSLNYPEKQSTEHQLIRVKESASDLIRLISLRREELANLTRGKTGKNFEKMEATFKKSVQKALDLMERVNKQHKSLVTLLSEIESRLEKIRSKLESYWSNLQNSHPQINARNHYNNHYVETQSENSKSLNADWFLSMGQQREKIRRSEKQSEWMFNRARNREEERKSRKFQTTHKKQKSFQGNPWNHYSS